MFCSSLQAQNLKEASRVDWTRELRAIEDARAADRSGLGNAAQLSTTVDGGAFPELPGLPLPTFQALAMAARHPSFHPSLSGSVRFLDSYPQVSIHSQLSS